MLFPFKIICTKLYDIPIKYSYPIQIILKQIYLTLRMGSEHVLSIRIIVDQGVIAMMGYALTLCVRKSSFKVLM